MSPAHPIPQCSPLAGYKELATDIDAAVRRVLEGGHYILGNEVAEFEREFAHFCGSRHAAGVANGTDALSLALRALGIGPGDAVLTVSLSAVATAVAIRTTGATPFFVDVDAARGVMDPSNVENVLRSTGERNGGPRIKAIVPVHLYGGSVDMSEIVALADHHGLAIVEDCAQAHGATSGGRPVGTFGAFGCFSFYPTKNLGAIGDGGAVVTSDPDLREKVRLLREYGWRERYISAIEGTNSRLDELQAAILRVKLKALAKDNAARQRIAELYRTHLDPSKVTVPPASPGHVYHQFVVRSSARDDLQQYLRAKGIGTLVHYPRAIHEQPAYADPGFRSSALPNTEAWAAEVLSLPMFPQLAEADAMAVVDAINAWNGR